MLSEIRVLPTFLKKNQFKTWLQISACFEQRFCQLQHISIILKKKTSTCWERPKGRWRSTWAALAWLRNLRQKLREKWLCSGRACSCGNLTGRIIMYHDKHESYGWYYIASMNYLVLGKLSCAKQTQMSTWLDCGRYESIWKMDAKMQRSFYGEEAIIYLFTEIVQRWFIEL